MPRVLSKHYRIGDWRRFDYERDLLPRLDWQSFSFRGADRFVADDRERIDRTRVRLDVNDLAASGPLAALQETSDVLDLEIDVTAMVRLLLDVIPNPWQAARIFNDTLAKLRGRDISAGRLFTSRLALVDAIKDDLKAQVHAAGEAEFRRMLSAGELSFQLVSRGDPELNWELAESLWLDVSDDDKILLRKNGLPLGKSLFDPVYQKEINPLEREVAWYLDADLAVQRPEPRCSMVGREEQS
jgi:hypothetical protein